MVTSELNQANKRLVWKYWQTLESTSADRLEETMASSVVAGATWHGPDPINELCGVKSFVSDFWLPLQKSFRDLRRQTHIFFGGQSNGRIDGKNDGNMWVTGTGYLNGIFVEDYLSIPASNSEVNIRWGEFCRLEEGRITESFFLLDLVDLIQQAGFNVLPPSRGADGIYPPPRANDGILLDAQTEEKSQYSLDHIRRFIFDGLNRFDQSDLKSMGMADFFHPDVKWYGPGGIGACLSFRDFESLHQQPWLHAFPDRSVQNLDALFAEGGYSGAPGWAGVKATHAGEYLEHAASGNVVEINGLDWWKRDGEVYIENWVFVDMIHLFRQLGVDLFERLAQQRESLQSDMR